MAKILKSLVWGYEVPTFELTDNNSRKLSSEIYSNLDPRFDTLVCDLQSMELTNSNNLIILTMVIFINDKCLPKKELDQKISELNTAIGKVIETYLSDNKVLFNKLND